MASILSWITARPGYSCAYCALALASACASPNSGRNLQPDLQEIPLLRDEWVMVANSELAAALAGVPQEQ